MLSCMTLFTYSFLVGSIEYCGMVWGSDPSVAIDSAAQKAPGSHGKVSVKALGQRSKRAIFEACI